MKASQSDHVLKLKNLSAASPFYQTYRNIEQITQQNEYFNVPDSLQTQFVKSVKQLNLLPKCLGLFDLEQKGRPIKSFNGSALTKCNS